MSDLVNKEYQATPATTLEQQIMDPNFPKNEREWWAADRIEQLEAALKPLCCTCDRAASDECSRAEVDCPFWNARAALGEERT